MQTSAWSPSLYSPATRPQERRPHWTFHASDQITLRSRYCASPWNQQPLPSCFKAGSSAAEVSLASSVSRLQPLIKNYIDLSERVRGIIFDALLRHQILHLILLVTCIMMLLLTHGIHYLVIKKELTIRRRGTHLNLCRMGLVGGTWRASHLGKLDPHLSPLRREIVTQVITRHNLRIIIECY